MPWQTFDKRRPSVWLQAHPPLTSLRSFAPPYAGAKGAYAFSTRLGGRDYGAPLAPWIPAEAGMT